MMQYIKWKIYNVNQYRKKKKNSQLILVKQKPDANKEDKSKISGLLLSVKDTGHVIDLWKLETNFREQIYQRHSNN